MVGIFDLAKLMTGFNLFKKVPQENIEYSKELIENAKKNLSDSYDLYNKKNYNLAIYYLEQSLYSSVKSLVLLFQMVKLKDVKDKNYNSFEDFVNKNKIFDKLKKIVNQNSTMYEVLLSEENKKKFKEDYEKYKKEVDEFLKKLKDKNERKNIVRYNENDLNNLFSINELINKYQMSEEVIESLINFAMNLFSRMGGKANNVLNTGMARSLIKRELEKNKDTLNIFGNILILTGILMLHERSTKEYDKDLDFSPDNYNQDLGVVKLYNKMYDMVNGLIKFNENFVNVLENKDNLKLF
ncbi:HEPN domain containing protein [Candidatus Nanobsidianus stetteri]|uniref:HEPN domain containing protein n=1 Tax=Nanobsidianus stetteri TaxID=1294122 RepID=R1G8V3_NANST|nr:HEPN domain containing protein [Candidatus Nanobsidianus stetteri]